MKLNGVVTSKLRHLEAVLDELASLVPLSLEQLQQNWLIRRAVERNLQISVEVVLDVCHRVLALAGRTPPPTGRATLEAAEHLGLLRSADKYRPLVGFRNLLVHEYDEVKLEIVLDIVNHRLGVLLDFRNEVLDYVSR